MAIWLLLVMLAILNGTLREKVWMPILGSGGALPASGITLSALILLIAWLTVPWFGRMQAAHYWLVGAIWLSVTVVFEFGFGRLVAGKPWPELLEAYNVFSGNLWIVVLLVTLFAPYAAARLRGHV